MHIKKVMDGNIWRIQQQHLMEILKHAKEISNNVVRMLMQIQFTEYFEQKFKLSSRGHYVSIKQK